MEEALTMSQGPQMTKTRDTQQNGMLMYIADPYEDDDIWCISDEGAKSNPMMLYSRPEAMPEFLFLGIDAELELLATFS